MDIGMILTIRNYPEDPEPLADVYRRNLEDAAYAEQLGFDFVWVSEHHFAPDAWSPSPLHVLTAIAAHEPHRTWHQAVADAILSSAAPGGDVATLTSSPTDDSPDWRLVLAQSRTSS